MQWIKQLKSRRVSWKWLLLDSPCMIVRPNFAGRMTLIEKRFLSIASSEVSEHAKMPAYREHTI